MSEKSEIQDTRFTLRPPIRVSRFDILLISLDPSQGAEIKKTRPCLVISPNEMNKYINTLIVAPMTSKIKNYPTRIPITFGGKKGSIVLDQIRTKNCTLNVL